MKKLHRIIIICLLIVFPVSSLSFRNLQTMFVFFSNSGFEINPANGTSGWVWPSSDWTWDGSRSHNGTHSARVYRGTGSATASLYSANISVKSSTNYTFTYWLRTQNATFWPSVSLYQFKTGQVQTGPRLIAHANIFGGTSSWNKISYRFQTMPDATVIHIRVYLPIASGTFWFDDFGLEEESAALYPYHTGFPKVANGSVFVSSPVVADIDNNGTNELVIAGGSSVNGWDSNGIVLTGFPFNTNDKHIQSQLVVADLDGNGDLEIAAGTKTPISDGQGRVFVWHHTGVLLNGWPKSVAWNTQYANNESLVSTIAYADIDGDKDLEILAGTSNNTAGYSGSTPPSSPNLYAWHINGSLLPGLWPTWHNTAGFYGCIATGDLDGDGVADVEIGRDHHFLNVYDSTGNSLSGWPTEIYVNGNSGSYNVDEHIDYPKSAPVIADLDGDGENEFVVAGFVGGPGALPLKNSALLVFEPDGRRRPGWETPALGNGLLNLEDLSIQAPAVADINMDGLLEIIIDTKDGWIRAYKTDKTVLWSFNYTQGAVLEATEPVIGDIDGDNSLEILFGTRVPSQQEAIFYSGPVGLWALEADGQVVTGFPLPIPTPGLFGAPTLADLDKDGKLEILVGAREGEVIVWDTPTEFKAYQNPWPTGRHDLSRTSTYIQLNSLEASYKSASKEFVKQGDSVKFTIHVLSSSPINVSLSLTDSIPPGLSFVPNSLSATSGNVSYTEGVIYWSNNQSSILSVEITYLVVVTTTTPQVIQNEVVIDTVTSGFLKRTATLYTNLLQVFIPIVKR